MARDYKPTTPFIVAALCIPPTFKKVKGVRQKTYNDADAFKFNCSFRTFGGSEKTVNDVIVVENTAVVETWYTPKITSDCIVRVNDIDYEILGTPENINMRNQYLKFKIRAIKGGA